MTPEPLKGKHDELISKNSLDKKATDCKVGFVEGIAKSFECFKSAVEGLIKFHEDRIEIAIVELEGEPWHPTMKSVFDFIDYEYESIIAIEHWLEDVIS